MQQFPVLHLVLLELHAKNALFSKTYYLLSGKSFSMLIYAKICSVHATTKLQLLE